MTYTAELVEDEAPELVKLRSVARILLWVSGSWAVLNVLGVIGTVMLIVLSVGEVEDALRNGTYNVIFGALALLIWSGAWQMSKVRNYLFSFAAVLLCCIPCLSPWFLIGIPFGVRLFLLLLKPDVKSAFLVAKQTS